MILIELRKGKISVIRGAFNKAGAHSANEIQNFLNDIKLVGDKKLLGYLPLRTITEICHENPHTLQKEAELKGLKTLLLQPESCDVSSGALYVYDPLKLQIFILLPPNKAILERNGWPTDVDSFVKNVINVLADDKMLYDLVALSFSDKRPDYQRYVRQTTISPVPWSPF